MMIYYRDDEILIRDLRESDIQPLVEGEREQGWDSSPDKLEMRLRDHAEGRAIAFAAEYKGNAAGYINLYFRIGGGPFAGTSYPEIVDFGVLEKYRGNGIGSRLMDIAEKLAAQRSDTVCLGVGLHSGYGSAQRMYVKRGYIPDGSGVWYRGEVCPQYSECCNGDDLVLYFSKKL